ncbi:MFS general substrate transporter [Thozetella sp. PMI_491]|nr:MFS general substrate transporter [Thozetella sp. PMI_491]
MAISKSTLTAVTTILVVTLSMVNFSYDAGMINQLLLNENFYMYFELNSTYVGLTVAILNVGNFVAGPFVGPLIDRVGRKKGILLGNCLIIIGVIIQAAAQNTLLAGRFILGLGLGITAVAGPTLAAEGTPGHLHGLLTNASMPGLPIVGSIVSASGIAVYQSTNDWGWRGIILGEALERIIPANGDSHEDAVHAEYEMIVQTLQYESEHSESAKALIFNPPDRRRFLIAVLTNVFYQTCGANTLPYFFTLVLGSIGIVEIYTLLYLNLGLTLFGAVSLISGLWICHRFGSKTVMLSHTTIITVCLVLLSIFTALGPEQGRGIGAVVVTFVFWFAATSCWMILEFTYPVEVLRFSLRGSGTALAQAVGYAFQVMMNYTLPTALETIGWKFYAINAAWDALIVVAIWFLFVETKGKTLEEIDALFDGKVHFHVDEPSDDVKVGVIYGLEETTPKQVSVTSVAPKNKENITDKC